MEPATGEALAAPAAKPAATGAQVARGVGWMVLFKLSERSVGFISTLILARLLSPNDFGLVAMATAVSAGAGLMSAFGFESALIQRQHVDRSHYDTAWSYNVVFGVAVALLVVAAAVPAASFYREPRLELVLYVLAAVSLVQGFENIGTVQFRKELDFHKEFRFLIAKRVVSFGVTMALAFTLRNYWALVGGILAGAIIGVAISYIAHGYRPRFSFAARAHLFHFSKWLFMSNVIHFFRTRTSDFILGRTVGSHGLGIYSVAAEIAMLPSTELIAPLNRALFPIYSRLLDNLDALRRRFVQVYGVIAIVAFPVALGLACVAEEAVLLLLGNQWVEATPVIRIMTVVGLLSALQSNLYLVIIAMGHPKVNTSVAGALLLVSLPACILASLQYGVVGVAWTYLVLAIVEFAAIQVAFFRVSGLRANRYFAVVWRPLLASIVMAAGVLTLHNRLAGHASTVETLVSMIGAGAALYAITLLLVWFACGRPAGPEASILTTLRSRLHRR